MDHLFWMKSNVYMQEFKTSDRALNGVNVLFCRIKYAHHSFCYHAKGFVDLPLGPSLLDNGLDGLWDGGPRLDKWIHGSTYFGPW